VLDQLEVLKAGGCIDELVCWYLDGDGHAVSESAGVNTAIVHQGDFDLVEDGSDPASVKLFWQGMNGEPNAGGFHGGYSASSLCGVAAMFIRVIVKGS